MSRSRAFYQFFGLSGGDHVADLLRSDAEREAMMVALGSLSAHIAAEVQADPQLPEPVGMFSSNYWCEATDRAVVLRGHHSWYAPQLSASQPPAELNTSYQLTAVGLAGEPLDTNLVHMSDGLPDHPHSLTAAFAELAEAAGRDIGHPAYLVGQFAVTMDNTAIALRLRTE